MITDKQIEEALILESLCDKADTPAGLLEVERQVLIKCARSSAKLIKDMHKGSEIERS